MQNFVSTKSYFQRNYKLQVLLFLYFLLFFIDGTLHLQEVKLLVYGLYVAGAAVSLLGATRQLNVATLDKLVVTAVVNIAVLLTASRQ